MSEAVEQHVAQLARTVAAAFKDVVRDSVRQRGQPTIKEVRVDLVLLAARPGYVKQLVAAAVEALRSSPFEKFERLPEHPGFGGKYGIVEDGDVLVRWYLGRDFYGLYATIDWATDLPTS